MSILNVFVFAYIAIIIIALPSALIIQLIFQQFEMARMAKMNKIATEEYIKSAQKAMEMQFIMHAERASES